MNGIHDKMLIGCGAGFGGDRYDAAGPVIAAMSGFEGPKYLIFECLAERTLAAAQLERLREPTKGYSPFLDKYVEPNIAAALKAGIKVVTNLGAANPVAAAARVASIGSAVGCGPFLVVAVVGDDIRATFSDADIRAASWIDGADHRDKPILAANAYLGADAVARALQAGADIVLVGRTTDSALVLGPILHEFGWRDPDLLASGIVCGHLLECGAQVSGSYFADPGFKDVPDLAHVGFPIAEVRRSGDVTITKPADTGGRLDVSTVTEQLLYEIHDPSAYVTPDVICDLSGVNLRQEAADRVSVSNARGRGRPSALKVTVAVDDGWLSEAEMSYGGPNAFRRATLAGEIVLQRLQEAGVRRPVAFDIIGAGAALGRGHAAYRDGQDFSGDDFRLRLALASPDQGEAERLVDEVRALYTCGPAGGGGFRSHFAPQLATGSILVPRDQVEPHVELHRVPGGTS